MITIVGIAATAAAGRRWIRNLNTRVSRGALSNLAGVSLIKVTTLRIVLAINATPVETNIAARAVTIGHALHTLMRGCVANGATGTVRIGLAATRSGRNLGAAEVGTLTHEATIG